jgi:hypothetical protein
MLFTCTVTLATTPFFDQEPVPPDGTTITVEFTVTVPAGSEVSTPTVIVDAPTTPSQPTQTERYGKPISDLWFVNVPIWRVNDGDVLELLSKLPPGVRTYDHAYKNNYSLPAPEKLTGGWSGVDMQQPYQMNRLFNALNPNGESYEIVAFEDLPWLDKRAQLKSKEYREQLEEDSEYPNKLVPLDRPEIVENYGLPPNVTAKQLSQQVSDRYIVYESLGVGNMYQYNEIWGDRYPGIADQRNYLAPLYLTMQAAGLPTLAPPMEFVGDRSQREGTVAILNYGPDALMGLDYDIYCSNIYSNKGTDNGRPPWVEGGAFDALDAAVEYATNHNADLIIGEACVNSYQSSEQEQAKWELLLAFYAWSNDVAYGHYGDADGANLGVPLFDGCGLLDKNNNPKVVFEAFKSVFDLVGNNWVSDFKTTGEGDDTRYDITFSDNEGDTYEFTIKQSDTSKLYTVTDLR